eukprot:1917092-Pleurochrysis_carterae.AAC.1
MLSRKPSEASRLGDYDAHGSKRLCSEGMSRIPVRNRYNADDADDLLQARKLIHSDRFGVSRGGVGGDGAAWWQRPRGGRRRAVVLVLVICADASIWRSRLGVVVTRVAVVVVVTRVAVVV